MSDQDQDSKPWWQSRTVWFALVPVIVSIVHSFGVTLPPDVQASLPDVLVSVSGGIGGILAIYFRIKASKTISTVKKDPQA